MEKFENGEYFVYVNGNINGRYELGKVKRPNNNGTGYFCWYHTGDTCANTPVECMHKLVNAYVIKEDGFAKAIELKPVPERKKTNAPNEHLIYYKMGWNDCIDKILGEDYE